MNAMYRLIVLSVALVITPLGLTDRTQIALDDCPKLEISCPDEVPESGKTYVVKLHVEGAHDPEKLSYKWSVSSGEIIDGQGTPTMKVRFTEGGKTLTATVEVGGLPKNCPNTASCSFAVS